MQDKLTLMTPGPTPVPEAVLKVMGCHPIGHRSREFEAIIQEISGQLRWLHQTSNDVLIITGSGTAAMEAAIVNTLKSKDRILCGDNGKFGERWVELARAYGLEVEVIRSPWGQPLDSEAFRVVLEADTEKLIKAVILTHSETSTGVINDLKSISKHVNSHGVALSIVDCVTSMGVVNVPIDVWGIDVVCSGSQKGYMMPPGLAFIAMSPRAWQYQENSTLPKFYFNLSFYRKTSIKNSSPFTPAINLYFALKEALTIMRQEGLESIFKRHDENSRAIQAAVKAMGLSLYACDGYRSPSVTAIQTIDFEAELLLSLMRNKLDILLANGQDHLKGRIFRIGHLGFVSNRDILTIVASMESVLHTIRPGKVVLGRGLAAAINELSSRTKD
ncbi:soluble hydrogenase small subunit (chromatophore) [Paulinella micropora]|uniref:alanine--glyoxylate transaminase n=1 Tax=Paulinella micropora TaxID=1928728 RepID=A0A1L5YBX8_9EUKA|nr:soluble hydrogenase small subunit [Paulinella micropora]AQX44975.1 soluble hydrogenase small subunit [Paulinella micropora]BBL86189.1 soluble hydrogenase small subunit [Paulinella micropora]